MKPQNNSLETDPHPSYPRISPSAGAYLSLARRRMGDVLRAKMSIRGGDDRSLRMAAGSPRTPSMDPWSGKSMLATDDYSVDETRIDIESALALLDPRSREVAELFLLDDMSQSEAADYLRLSEDAVRETWNGAMTVLKEKFRDYLARETLESSSIVRPETSIITLDLVDHRLVETLREHPELLRTLDWRSFEKVLARILEALEYEVELTCGTKDGGIDIFALKKEGPFGKHRYLIQAKRWTKTVGVAPVRELMFLHDHHRVSKSCLATTSTFTRGACKLANQYSWQLTLADYDRLQEWIHLAPAEQPIRC